MRIVKNLAAIAAALMLVGSLAGCGYVTQTMGDVVDQAQHELGEIQPGAETGAEAPFEGHSATVVRVVDGDTIAVQPTATLAATNDSGTEHVVRLLAIDAPEMNKMSDDPAECGAQASLDHLAGLLGSGVEVTVVYDSLADRTDRYGRSLAYVLLADGTDAALSMVTAGYAAAWYPSGEPEPAGFPAYAAAQLAASTSNAGAHATCDSIGR